MSISSSPKFTDKQGQYLAFIYLYTKLNRQAPTDRVRRDALEFDALELHEFVGEELQCPA